MQGDNPISWLMFFTLAATVFIIAGSFIYFLRSRTNREIAANALQGDGRSRGVAPSGAGGELVIFATLAIAVMGLLVAGYRGKPQVETAQMTTPVGVTTGQAPSASGSTAPSAGTTGMAQPVGTPDRPKQYQPANPAPDLRAAPTSSDTGVGSENGSTGTPK